MKTNFGQAGRMHAVEMNDVGIEQQDKANADPHRAREAEDLLEYDTGTLFAGRREIVIHHAGAAYRMKITRQGKLILNK